MLVLIAWLRCLHTNDSISTITRLLNMGVANFLITSSLILIISQRLGRRICQKCKIIDDVPSHILIKLGFSEQEALRSVLYKGAGCTGCSNKGTKGRVGLYELLKMTDGLKSLILSNKTASELKEYAIEKDGFKTLEDTGKRLLIEGVLSIDEYQRILSVEI